MENKRESSRVEALSIASTSVNDAKRVCTDLLQSCASKDITTLEVVQVMWLRLLRDVHSLPFDSKHALTTFWMLQYFLQQKTNTELGSMWETLRVQIDQYDFLGMLQKVFERQNTHDERMGTSYEWLVEQLSNTEDNLFPEISPSTEYDALFRRFYNSPEGKSLSSIEMKRRLKLFEHVGKVVQLTPDHMKPQLYNLVETLCSSVHSAGGFAALLYLSTEVERLSTSQITFPVESPKGVADDTPDFLKEDTEAEAEPPLIRYIPSENRSQFEQFVGTGLSATVPTYDHLTLPPATPVPAREEPSTEFTKHYRRPFATSTEWRKGG